MASALDLVDDAIADLQARLNLNPSATKGGANNAKKQEKKQGNNNSNNQKKGGGKPKQPKQPPKKVAEPPDDQPDICKLEFKVGVITKVWLQ